MGLSLPAIFYFLKNRKVNSICSNTIAFANFECHAHKHILTYLLYFFNLKDLCTTFKK